MEGFTPYQPEPYPSNYCVERLDNYFTFSYFFELFYLSFRFIALDFLPILAASTTYHPS